MWAKIITIKRTKDLNYFSLCALNFINTRVSQFELNYWNKWLFHDILIYWDAPVYINIFPIFYDPIWLSLCELYPPFPVLRWQERHPVWSSAAGAHLFQGSTCCAFRDCILHTMVVTSGYFSYWLLPFYHLYPVCPFSSDLWHQQDIFVHTTASHWIFSLFRTILCKP